MDTFVYGLLVVAIDQKGFPSERSNFFDDRIEIGMDLACPAKGLKIVQVHNGYDIFHSQSRRKKHDFPNRALLQLSIAHDDVYGPVYAGDFIRECHTDCDSEPMTQRAGRGFDPRYAVIRSRSEY